MSLFFSSDGLIDRLTDLFGDVCCRHRVWRQRWSSCCWTLAVCASLSSVVESLRCRKLKSFSWSSVIRRRSHLQSATALTTSAWLKVRPAWLTTTCKRSPRPVDEWSLRFFSRFLLRPHINPWCNDVVKLMLIWLSSGNQWHQVRLGGMAPSNIMKCLSVSTLLLGWVTIH